jgi:hypothetical protein
MPPLFTPHNPHILFPVPRLSRGVRPYLIARMSPNSNAYRVLLLYAAQSRLQLNVWRVGDEASRADILAGGRTLKDTMRPLIIGT